MTTQKHAQPSSDGVFALPEHRSAKAAPALVAADETHLRRVDDRLRTAVADLGRRLDEQRRAPVQHGALAMDRDAEVRRVESRLRTLRRFGLDLCLGRMVPADGSPPVYVGRLGLDDGEGGRLLVDWRSPAAAPYFGATHAAPMGLASRRRFRWSQGRVVDYWDEVFDDAAPGADVDRATLDEQSSFVAGLGAARSPRMRDVLGTIQADQDAIIRAGSVGALVVDGGPGTGKTVVALHRAAYLLHTDPRLGAGRGGILVVGPHRPYLGYVGDVLPSLGEDGVRTCTLRDLVPEGATAPEDGDPEVARLKSTVAMVEAIEPAVALHEEPPTRTVVVDTPWCQVRMRPVDWAEAFAAADPGAPHDEVRDQVWEAVLEILLDQHDASDPGSDDEDGPSPDAVGHELQQHEELVETFRRAWPIVEHTDLVADLWEVPAYLRRCAPHLSPDEVRLLRRADPHAWTVSDLPLLDAARRRLGDPGASARRRRRAATAVMERERMHRVVDDLVGAEAVGGLASMPRQDVLQDALVDQAALETADPDALAGPFAHVVVDEAQELTDAQWQMVLARCPTRSLTVVGDRAQARRGFPESWQERLARVGVPDVVVAPLTVSYRTPASIMAVAEPVVREVLPDANVPTSIRTDGDPVEHGRTDRLVPLLRAWLDAHDGTACVVAPDGLTLPDLTALPRVRRLAPVLTKGLEFDLVVLVEPDAFGDGLEGAVDRYVAMTRATQRLVVLTRP